MSSTEKVIEQLEAKLEEAHKTIQELKKQTGEPSALTIEQLKRNVAASRDPKTRYGEHQESYITNDSAMAELFEYAGMIARDMARGKFIQGSFLALAVRALRLYEEGYEREIPF